uniref:Uncharacterized protein n=1 Tax=Emiliania huxleyi TaxID=2903 RepID=A0A6V2Y693_EMIHU
MAPAATPPATLLADIAAADLASLRAFLSGWGTRGTSLTAQLDARLDTEKQDTLLTLAARHGQAEAVRLLLEAGASVGVTTGGRGAKGSVHSTSAEGRCQSEGLAPQHARSVRWVHVSA